jgi:hypothetical protein
MKEFQTVIAKLNQNMEKSKQQMLTSLRQVAENLEQ